MVNSSKVTGLTLGTDYLQSDSLYVGKYNSTTNKCEGPYTSLSLTLLNSSNNQYKGLFPTYSNVYSATKGETNIPVVDNKMCFVFFTNGYDDYDYADFELVVRVE